MIHLNRKTEYALLALRYLSERGAHGPCSVHAISTYYCVPEMVLAKVLQRLKSGDLVTAQKGAGGGYTLKRSTRDIAFTDVLRLFAESTYMVDCLPDSSHNDCQQGAKCDIRRPLEMLNNALLRHLDGLSLQVFFASATVTPTESLSLRHEHTSPSLLD